MTRLLYRIDHGNHIHRHRAFNQLFKVLLKNEQANKDQMFEDRISYARQRPGQITRKSNLQETDTM